MSLNIMNKMTFSIQARETRKADAEVNQIR